MENEENSVETVKEPITYEEKLEQLLKVYGEDYSKIPPLDMILSGTAETGPEDLTVSQLYAINNALLYRLKEVAESGDHMGARMLTEEKVGHFVEWLKPQSVEFQILALRMMLVIYNHKHIVNAVNNQTDWLESLRPFIEVKD
jgi:hypothetical protein